MDVLFHLNFALGAFRGRDGNFWIVYRGISSDALNLRIAKRCVYMHSTPSISISGDFRSWVAYQGRSALELRYLCLRVLSLCVWDSICGFLCG